MALAQKLEQDNLQLVCQRSVEELHQLFVAWFQGTEPKDGLTTSLMECLAPDFSHVAPNGQFLQGRSILISHLQDKYACYNNRLFQIEIYDVKLLWQDANGDRCLCTYEEWQSWLPDNAQELSNHEGDDNEYGSPSPPQQLDPENEEEGMHQFGRLSTCLLERKEHVPTDGSSGAYRWVHVHETWLEAESPQHEKSQQHSNGGGEESSYLEEETILTGPVEYHKMIAKRSPANMLDDGEEDSDEDDHDMVSPTRSLSADDEDDDDEEDSEGPPSPNGILGATPKKEAEAEAAEAAGTFAAATTFNAISRNHSQDTSTDSGGQMEESEEEEEEDGDETDEAVDRHLLMLMSNQSISRDQMRRQDDARNILENTGIAFYELDGANPEERENRNSLFQLSGKWGQYPQFFMVDTAGSTTFWGDYEKFEASHKAGRLQAEIESQLDDTTEAEDDGTDNDESSMPQLPPVLPSPSKSDRSSSPAPSVEDSSASSSDDDEPKQQPLSREVTPSPTSLSRPQGVQKQNSSNMPLVAANCKLLLLMSAQTLSRDQKHRQEELEEHLRDKGIAFESVDGSAKGSREKRNQLFRVSTFWGKYPQLFHEDKADGTVTYWGAWDEFEASVERDTVEHDLSYVSPPPPPTKEQKQHRKASLSHSLAAMAKDSEKESPKKTPEEKSPGKNSAESIGSASNLKSLPTAASALAMSAKQDPKGATSSTLKFDQPIILLLSNQSLSREQMNRQTQARKYLKGLEITELDGSSREHRHARNELFKISKLWGRYPQLHLKPPDQDEPVFFGDWEKLDKAHSNGTLKQEIMAIVAPNESFTSYSTSTISEQDSAVTANNPIPPLLDSKISPGDKVNGAPSWATGSGAVARRSAASPGKAKTATPDHAFLEKADGILQFEEEKGSKDEKKSEEKMDEEKLKAVQSTQSPIPQDASSKRHVSSKLLQHAKPLTWENSLVGLSINGFDIGTSQGPTADANWYKEVTDALEIVAQYKGASGAPQARRKLALPDTVYPTAHVALEGHGFWLSWDVLDAMEEWARAHSEIEVHSTQARRGVSVMRSRDGERFWEHKSTAKERGHQPANFHFDWTYSTPFPGKVEGGEWVELDESGMRVDLLTDTSVPILFFDEIVLFEDDLQEHGQVQFSVKLRVMPSCAYVLARLYIRVDQVTIRVRESRLLVDFMGISPSVYRDVTWRECPWELLVHNKLPTSTKEWHFDGKETPAWQNLLRKVPEVDPPEGVMKFAKLEPSKALLVKQLNNNVAEALSMSGGVGDSSLDYLEV